MTKDKLQTIRKSQITKFKSQTGQEITKDKSQITNNALQDLLLAQPPVIIGLISNFIGSALQEEIASTLLRMQQFGQDILCLQPKTEGGSQGRF